jgi:hypothetical protein
MKLTEVYVNNLTRVQDPNDENYEIDMEAYYTNMRVILFFFASPYDDPELCRDYCRDDETSA